MLRMYVYDASKHALPDAHGCPGRIMACKGGEGLLLPACCCPSPAQQPASCLRIAVSMLYMTAETLRSAGMQAGASNVKQSLSGALVTFFAHGTILRNATPAGSLVKGYCEAIETCQSPLRCLNAASKAKAVQCYGHPHHELHSLVYIDFETVALQVRQFTSRCGH